MKHVVFVVVFLSLPAMAIAGLPRGGDLRIAGEALETETVDPLLFNATTRTIALQLSCKPNCMPTGTATGAN